MNSLKSSLKICNIFPLKYFFLTHFIGMMVRSVTRCNCCFCDHMFHASWMPLLSSMSSAAKTALIIMTNGNLMLLSGSVV